MTLAELHRALLAFFPYRLRGRARLMTCAVERTGEAEEGMRMSVSPREARRRAGRDDALGRFGARAARALTFMYSLTPAQSGNPGIRSWQKSTNAWFAAMTTGVVGHSVSSRSNVMTSTSDPRGDADAEAARVRREERHRARRDDDDARAALAGALSVAAMARGEVCLSLIHI